MTLKNFYLNKIYNDGIEIKTKNYLIHQENLFYRSLTKQKEFTSRHFDILFHKNPVKDRHVKSVRFFRLIMSAYILLLFWKKYTEIFQSYNAKNSKLTKQELIDEIFWEKEENNEENSNPDS